MSICFDEIQKAYPTKSGIVTAVRDVSFTVPSGSVIGVLGPNGSGKTSLMKMLLDLTQPDSGSIHVDDTLWGNRCVAFRKRVGYLPEERGFYKKEKVLETLIYLACLKGVDKKEAASRARILLDKVGLTDFINRPLTALSKGMSQKVQFIAALIHDPDILVMDEPFSGLDPVNVAMVRDSILERKKAGALVFISTHRMNEVEKLCDFIVMLNKGKLVLSGSIDDIRSSSSLKPRIFVNRLASIEGLKNVSEGTEFGNQKELLLNKGTTISDFLRELAEATVPIRELQIAPPSLEQLYLQAIVPTDD